MAPFWGTKNGPQNGGRLICFYTFDLILGSIFDAIMCFQNIHHIGDTKSAQELEVFSYSQCRSACPQGREDWSACWGVFGAGKTRSAAVLLAGLLVYDPSLKLMVVTKENVAAHAIAEHLVALQLPQEVQQLMGRLVGYYEQRRKGSGTPLDLPVENRNHQIRQKSLLTECGGGFFLECGQPYNV